VEAQVLRYIFDLSVQGFGVNKIANELNKRETPPRRGREWTSSIISYILSSNRLKYYLGIDKENMEGGWPPLLDLKLYDDLTQEGHKPVADKKIKEKPHENYLLTGIGVLKCGYCHGNVKASITTRDQKKNLYYLCSRKQNAGLAACVDSKLHRQAKINEIVLNNLKEITSKDMFDLIVTKSDLLKEQYQSEVVNIFNNVSNEFRAKYQVDPNGAVELIEDGYKAIKVVQSDSDKIRIPEELNLDDPQKSIKHNVKKILLYNDKIKIIYHFPIQDNLDPSTDIDFNRYNFPASQ
jgi:hypothetical protein